MTSNNKYQLKTHNYKHQQIKTHEFYQNTIILQMNLQKDHYQTLGLQPGASKQQIEHAFHRLSNLYHPDKNPDNRIASQSKFNKVCEAFFILEDPSRRASYDDLRMKPSLDTALDLLLRFFDQFGFEDEYQRESFDKLYPNRALNYYEILGVRKNSGPEQIEMAFRKLSLRYHPKNNPDDKQSQKKFIDVCTAYNQLSDSQRRSAYDDFAFGQINTRNAHNIFMNFFRSVPFTNEEDTRFFRPLFKQRVIEQSRNRRVPSVHDYYQTSRINEYKSKKSNGDNEGRKITQRSYMQDGSRVLQRFQQTVNADGSRNVVQTTNKGGVVDTQSFNLKSGDPLPLQK